MLDKWLLDKIMQLWDVQKHMQQHYGFITVLI